MILSSCERFSWGIGPIGHMGDIGLILFWRWMKKKITHVEFELTEDKVCSRRWAGRPEIVLRLECRVLRDISQRLTVHREIPPVGRDDKGGLK